jgi:hypothetical protein
MVRFAVDWVTGGQSDRVAAGETLLTTHFSAQSTSRYPFGRVGAITQTTWATRSTNGNLAQAPA